MVRTSTLFFVVDDQHRGLSGSTASNGPLWNGDGVRTDGFDDFRAGEHAGHQQVLGIGNFGAERDRPVVGSTAISENNSLPAC